MTFLQKSRITSCSVLTGLIQGYHQNIYICVCVYISTGCNKRRDMSVYNVCLFRFSHQLLCCRRFFFIESCVFTPVCVYILSQGLADNTVIAKVNKAVWDLDRPLEEDCTLELLKFEDEEAQAVSFYSDS